MMVELHEHGHVEVHTMVHGVGLVTDAFYPLCGDAVQTEVFDGQYEARVRTDTHTQRVVTENYGP